jgi:Rrf2 family protein
LEQGGIGDATALSVGRATLYSKPIDNPRPPKGPLPDMMSQHTRYALKALLYLAKRPAGIPQPTTEIAMATSIPRKFLEAILLDLKRSGVIASTRGKHGGYVLSRTPDQITFGEVIRSTEGPLALLHCASRKFHRRCADCPDELACELRAVMIAARDKLASVLDHTSLADAETLIDRLPGELVDDATGRDVEGAEIA